jgi:DNA repair photolyase
MNDGPRRGRGATFDPGNRFHSRRREVVDDGWPRELEPSPRTVLGVDNSRSILSYNDSPDVPFDRSINPYRGCEHGCIYCYARPTHAYLDLSPGLDFETRLFHKPQAPAQLIEALQRPGYRPAPIALGANTDAWQPVEGRLRLTRRILAVLADCRHPATVVTKSALVERDTDLLADMAADGLVQVNISLTGLDLDLSQRMEPRAAPPQRRLETIRRLHEAGIPVHVLVAPVIPMLNDDALEDILAAAREAGAGSAGYVLLRLPREVAPLFEDWLRQHYPQRADRVLNRVRDTRGGALYDAGFDQRQSGSGVFAQLIAKRFQLACRRLGYRQPAALRCDLFRPPGQMSLF